jgi:hypothetical protein
MGIQPFESSVSSTIPQGPWLSAVAYVLDTPIVSKSNHRRTKGSGQWAKFRAFEEFVTFTTRSVLPAAWPSLDAEQPFAARPVVCLTIVASTLLDTANLSKSVADALEGVCYHNDASARAVSSLSVRSSAPHVVVGIAALDADASLDEVSTAAAALQDVSVKLFNATIPE